MPGIFCGLDLDGGSCASDFVGLVVHMLYCDLTEFR